jgi:hypothetical protein
MPRAETEPSSLKNCHVRSSACHRSHIRARDLYDVLRHDHRLPVRVRVCIGFWLFVVRGAWVYGCKLMSVSPGLLPSCLRQNQMAFYKPLIIMP